MASTWSDMMNQVQEWSQAGTQSILNGIKTTLPENFVPVGTPSVSPDFSYDVFPQDLGSDYYGHWMTITAIEGGIPTGPAGNFFGIAPNTSKYAVAIFIPSATSSSSLAYMDAHEYSDIKLTNVALSGVGAALGVGESLNQAAALAPMGGYAINPGVQILYRSTKLRQFQFTFLMSPVSQDESRSMENIIKTLRYYAAPELTGGGLAFRTPAEFQIKFYNKGQENPHIPMIRRCVLNRIDVDFTPLNGEWTTFTNGYPVSCIMSLLFQEMEIIHRDFIAGGN